MAPARIEVTTPSEREIVTRRTFNAPRELVFRAHTEPELVKRWLLGPPGWTMPVCRIDLKAGGRYRYVWRSEEDGSEFGMGGVFQEVMRPERIVHTELYDPNDPYAEKSHREGGTAGEALITTVFDGEGDATTLTLTMLFDSREARDGALATGMTDGMESSYQKLDELLASDAAGTR